MASLDLFIAAASTLAFTVSILFCAIALIYYALAILRGIEGQKRFTDAGNKWTSRGAFQLVSGVVLAGVGVSVAASGMALNIGDFAVCSFLPTGGLLAVSGLPLRYAGIALLVAGALFSVLRRFAGLLNVGVPSLSLMVIGANAMLLGWLLPLLAGGCALLK